MKKIAIICKSPDMNNSLASLSIKVFGFVFLFVYIYISIMSYKIEMFFTIDKKIAPLLIRLENVEAKLNAMFPPTNFNDGVSDTIQNNWISLLTSKLTSLLGQANLKNYTILTLFQ